MVMRKGSERMTWLKGYNAMYLKRATEGENVYFISDGDFVKIGKTTHSPLVRLSSLQTGNPRALMLLGVAFFGNGLDGTTLEWWLHGLLKEHCVRGEWFSLGALDALKDYLDKEAQQYGNVYTLGNIREYDRVKAHFILNDNMQEIIL